MKAAIGSALVAASLCASAAAPSQWVREGKACAVTTTRWSFCAWKDDMTDERVGVASVRSGTTAAGLLGQPVRMTLVATRSPRAASLQIDGGRLRCTLRSGCQVDVRVDDGEVRSMRALQDLGDLSNPVDAPLRDSSSLVEAMAAGKRVRIKATIEGSGPVVFDFQPQAPLSWPADLP